MAVSTETNALRDPDQALGMSDEEFANIDPSEFDEMFGEESPEQEPTDEPTGDEDEDAGASAEADESEDTEEVEDTDTTDQDEDPDVDEDGGEDEADDTDGDADESESEDEGADTEEDGEESDSEDETSEEEEESSIDYEAEYKRLMAPFKANGKEMKVQNVDEAIQLMQMGANYNKKMASLKPSLKTLKMLEKNELLDEGKLSHLIDLSKGDKGAIQKLIKDNGVDPMDLDDTEQSDYEPSTYTVDDAEMELDSVLEEIQDTPSYSETINVVTNKWDESSRNIVANNPSVLRTINSHVESGIYERVSAEVERQRAFGQLNGISDIEAYKQVGDRMDQEGAFADLAQGQNQSQNQPQQKPEQGQRKVARKPKKAKKEDPKLKDKKRAASPTRTKPAASSKTDFNPLGMSDEEFERSFNENLM